MASRGLGRTAHAEVTLWSCGLGPRERLGLEIHLFVALEVRSKRFHHRGIIRYHGQPE